MQAERHARMSLTQTGLALGITRSSVAKGERRAFIKLRDRLLEFPEVRVFLGLECAVSAPLDPPPPKPTGEAK